MNEIIHVKEQTYVFRHLQNSKHEEDVFLAILELLVLKVAVDVSVSQGKIFGQGFVVGSDVGFGFCLPLEPKGSASSVYLFQQLQWGVRRRQLITRRDTFQHTHKKQGYKSRYLHFFFHFFLIAELKTLIARGRTLQKRSMTYLIFFFFWLQKIVILKDCVNFQLIKQLRIIQRRQTVSRRKRERETKVIYNLQSSITFACWYNQRDFLLEMVRCQQIDFGEIFCRIWLTVYTRYVFSNPSFFHNFKICKVRI